MKKEKTGDHERSVASCMLILSSILEEERFLMV